MKAGWNCTELNYQRADGTKGVGTGEVVQDEIGRVEVRIIVERGLRLSDFADAQDVSGTGAQGQQIIASECWVTTYREEPNSAHATVVFSPSEVVISETQHQGPWTEHRVCVKGARWLG